MRHIVKISISLPYDLLRVVRDAVNTGDYASTSEAIREALRDWVLRRRPSQRPELRTDLTRSQLLDIELLCLRLDVLRLAVRGSARKAQVDFAVDFARFDTNYGEGERTQLRSSLALMLRRSVRLFSLEDVGDRAAWLTIYPQSGS